MCFTLYWNYKYSHFESYITIKAKYYGSISLFQCSSFVFVAVNLVYNFQSVISNEDVMTMVRQSLQRNGEIECPYEPKLTRAKTK